MPDMAHLLHAPSLRRRWGWLLVAMMAWSSWLAFMPSEPRPGMLPHMDKLEHLAGFTALAVVACLASGRPRPARLVGFALLAYGIFIELVQARLPSRHGEWLDLVADALGILLGLLLVQVMRRRWPRRTADA